MDSKVLDIPFLKEQTKKKLERFFGAATRLQKSIVAFVQPGTSGINVMIDMETDLTASRHDIHQLNKGFILGEFNEREKNYFLKADVFWSELNNQLEVSGHPALEAFLQTLDNDQDLEITSSVIQKETTESDFITTSNLIINKIKDHKFEKAVLSRNRITPSRPEQVIQSFIDSVERHTNSFRYLYYSARHGLWIGATPELLLSQHKQVFKTVALAGTQRDSGIPLIDAPWTQKEIEEQAYVSRYIIDCLKKIRLREFKEIGPKTVKAADLLHLQTEFEIDLSAVNFEELSTVMLELLHPTSAVCGYPFKSAYEFLMHHEKHKRELYSGYLGPIWDHGEIDLYVNLRCAKVHQNNAELFAGAGITKYSDPEKEWKETELKLETIGSIL